MRSGSSLAGAASAALPSCSSVVAFFAMLAGLRAFPPIAAKVSPWFAGSTRSRSIAPDQQNWMPGAVEDLKACEWRHRNQLGVVGFRPSSRLLVRSPIRVCSALSASAPISRATNIAARSMPPESFSRPAPTSNRAAVGRK